MACVACTGRVHGSLNKRSMRSTEPSSRPTCQRAVDLAPFAARKRRHMPMPMIRSPIAVMTAISQCAAACASCNKGLQQRPIPRSIHVDSWRRLRLGQRRPRWRTTPGRRGSALPTSYPRAPVYCGTSLFTRQAQLFRYTRNCTGPGFRNIVPERSIVSSNNRLPMVHTGAVHTTLAYTVHTRLFWQAARGAKSLSVEAASLHRPRPPRNTNDDESDGTFAGSVKLLCVAVMSWLTNREPQPNNRPLGSITCYVIVVSSEACTQACPRAKTIPHSPV